MDKPLPPDPGEFAGLHIKTIQGFTSLRSGGAIITTNKTIIACWAHAAWTFRIKQNRWNDERTANEARKNADAWLALAKGEQP